MGVKGQDKELGENIYAMKGEKYAKDNVKKYKRKQ